MADEAEIDTRQLQPVGSTTPGETSQWGANAAIGVFLGLITFFLFATPAILGRALSDTPEARIAVTAREMIVRDDYLVPHMGGEARLKKPPLPYWAAIYTAKLLESDAGPQKPPSQETLARAVELPSAFACAFAVFLVTLYGATVFSRPAGLLAGLMLGCCSMVTAYAFRGYGDTQLMAFTAMALCGAACIVTSPAPGFFSALVFGIGLGLAILVKGHIPLLIVTAPLVSEVLIRRAFSARKVLLILLGLFIAAAIAVPWFLMVEKAHPGSMQELIDEMKEAMTSTAHRQSDMFTYYWYKLGGGLLPWTPLILFGWLYYSTRGRNAVDPQERPEQLELYRANLRFMLLTAILGFIGFYIARKQQEYYLLPILPPLMLASAGAIGRLKFPGGRAEEGLAWSQLLIGVLVGAAIAVSPAWLPHVVHTAESREAIDRFIDATGWGVTIPVGIAVLLLHLALARQWVEGRIATAALISGAAAYAGLFAWGIHWTHKANSDPLSVEAPRLREELSKVSKTARVYGAGTSDAKLVFYLERPVHEFRDISEEKESAAPTERVLVISRDDLAKLDKRLNLSATAPEEQEYVTIPLAPDRDWPELVKSVQK